MEITFYGVRGSTPCAGQGTARYGGNTASVVLRDEDADPILLDLGTGTPVSVAARMNKQQPFGGDVLTRITATMLDPEAL